MRKTLFIILATISVQVFACGGYADYPKWSIGVIGVGNYYMGGPGWNPHFLPGIQVKRAKGPYALRFGVEHVRNYTEPTGEQGADIMYIEGNVKRTVLRAGMERGWNLHWRFSPYVAVDLAAQSMCSDMTYEGGIAGISERHEITTKGIGLMPTIGFKTNINRKIAFFAEYRAEAFVNDVYQKSTYYIGSIDSRPTRETEFDFAVGTIGHVGIQIAF